MVKGNQIGFNNRFAKGEIGLSVLMMEENKRFDRRERDLTNFKPFFFFVS